MDVFVGGGEAGEEGEVDGEELWVAMGDDVFDFVGVLCSGCEPHVAQVAQPAQPLQQQGHTRVLGTTDQN